MVEEEILSDSFSETILSRFDNLGSIRLSLTIAKSLTYIACEDEDFDSNPRTWSLLIAIMKYLEEIDESLPNTD